MYRLPRPETCAVCPKETIEPLIFSDYCREISSGSAPSRGLAWFCRRHAEAAMRLGTATLAEALAHLTPRPGA